MSVSYSAYQPSGQLGSKLEHVIITFQKNEIPLFGRAVEVVGWQSIFIVILCTLKQCMAEGEKVLLVGIGRFEMKTTKERIGKVPLSGAECIVPEHRRMKFHASETLADKIEEQQED